MTTSRYDRLIKAGRLFKHAHSSITRVIISIDFRAVAYSKIYGTDTMGTAGRTKFTWYKPSRKFYYGASDDHDPGDLILDPLWLWNRAYVCRAAGVRRWITIGTARVALALTRNPSSVGGSLLPTAGRQPRRACEGSGNQTSRHSEMPTYGNYSAGPRQWSCPSHHVLTGHRQ